ncbi:MAG TPA: M56 family metallopeptidase [Vicinamibacterales bacterium]|jgi:beta-lactamase regulating signal transducer with metallopeptidase domain
MDALLNWLWQGCAVTVAVGIAVTLCKRLSATTRYQVWWATLVLVLALPAFRTLGAALLPAPEQTLGVGSPSPVLILPLPRWPLAALVIAWLVWVGVLFSRAAAAFRRVQHLKRTCTPFPTDREAQLDHWTAIRASGRQVRLVVSDHVRYAAAIGLRSPVIAVAPVVLHELDDEDLDRILVHEWAHIQRRDDIARVFQLLVNVLVGFNPAVWWIDRRIEIEREVACDDRVIQITGCRTAYAKSLMRLAELPNRPVDLALVSAALSPPKLTTRIRQMLDLRRNVSTRRSAMALLLGTPGLLTLVVAISSLTPVISVVPELRAVVQAQQASQPPSAGAVEEDVATINGLSETPPSIPNFKLRPQQQQRAAEPASASLDSPRASAASEHADEPLGERAFLATRPIAIGVTPSTLVSLAHDTVPPTAPSGAVPGTPKVVASPWGAAATAGVTLGRTSQQAATRTAGFFTKLSQNIAGAF